MLANYVNGQTNVILRIKVPDSSKTNNVGIIGILHNSTGLQISTICDNESAPTVYSSLSSTIQSISTLGTYSAPSSGFCRFQAVDNVNLPGIYELQLENSRFSVSNAKSILITLLAIPALNVAQMDAEIGLLADDPYVSKPDNYNLMDIDSSGRLILQPTGLDSIVEDSYNIKQAIFVSAAVIGGEVSGLPTSPATFKSLDGATTRAVIAFDAFSNRLSSIITPP